MCQRSHIGMASISIGKGNLHAHAMVQPEKFYLNNGFIMESPCESENLNIVISQDVFDNTLSAPILDTIPTIEELGFNSEISLFFSVDI
jgi:hypothetical protein